ncbi:MAG: branched-chain amino acid ABC transporter permease [Chloroflexi bacterium]|nr:MAG: branched-chain amino acid ABC transporter permease [Chloroflexota bacterium]
MSANIRPAGTFDTSYEQDIALNRTRGDKLLAYGALLIILLIPLLTAAGPFGLDVVSVRWIGVINRIAILMIAVQGLNILLGYTGQISLGHAAFMAVGAYSSAILGREFGLTFWLALPLAALFTGFIGLLFGLPSLRVKGFYLAMATLAAQFIVQWFIVNFEPLVPYTRGALPLEVPHPTLFGLSFASDFAMFYIIVPLAVVSLIVARNLVRTRTGRAFISVRDNDLAAELLGINVFAYKLQAFFLSSVYAGVAGVLMAYDTNSLSISGFQLDFSIELLAMLIIGGAGFPMGPLFGVAFVNLLQDVIIPEVTPFTRDLLQTLLPFAEPASIAASINPFLFGISLIVFLILEPRGIAHRWEILKIAWKIRPYSY